MRLESGKVTEGRLTLSGGQIFRNSNLTGSFPTPTSVKDGAAPHLAHIVCSALRYFQTKAAPGIFFDVCTYRTLKQHVFCVIIQICVYAAGTYFRYLTTWYEPHATVYIPIIHIPGVCLLV